MPSGLTKLLALFISFCLILEQGVFAQSLDLSAHFANFGKSIAQTDKFRPLHLRYLGYDNLKQDFKLLLDKGDSKKEDLENKAYIEENTQTLLRYFFIGLTLPNDKFWVNLRPDSPDNILDPDLERTDIGRIFLEADLQLKKDTASFTSPQTPEGKAYWDKLYKKAGELFGSENITIPTLTRPWIVPNEIIIRESPEDAYIYKATLKVMLEEDYLQGHTYEVREPHLVGVESVYSFSDPRLKQLNEYSTQLIKEQIIPKLTYEVNTSKRYAPLRQVYYSLILAQWFKQRFKGRFSESNSLFGRTVPDIDSRDLTNLTSKEPYDKQTYFKQYQKSFQDGEYNLSEPIYTPFGQSIRRYMSGGEKFNIDIPRLGERSGGTAGSPTIVSIPAYGLPPENNLLKQEIFYDKIPTGMPAEKIASSSLDENTLKEMRENLQNYFDLEFSQKLAVLLDKQKAPVYERLKKLIIAIRNNDVNILQKHGLSQEEDKTFLAKLPDFITAFSIEKARELIQKSGRGEDYLPILEELRRLLFPAKTQLMQVIKILKEESNEFNRFIDLQNLPEDREIIFIGDLHGRIDNLKKILNHDNNLKKLQENKAVLVILGDAVHSKKNPKEMNTSLEIMQEIWDLKVNYLHNFFYVPGNHDFIDEKMGVVLQDGLKQWKLYKERMNELYGKDYIDLYEEFLKCSPLMVMGRGFVGMHAGPIIGPLKEGWRKKTFMEKLRKNSQNSKIIKQATWGTYQVKYGLKEIEQFLQNLGQSEAVFITGHNPQDITNWHWQISKQFHIIVGMRDKVGYAFIQNNKVNFVEVISPQEESKDDLSSLNNINPKIIEQLVREIGPSIEQVLNTITFRPSNLEKVDPKDNVGKQLQNVPRLEKKKGKYKLTVSEGKQIKGVSKLTFKDEPGEVYIKAGSFIYRFYFDDNSQKVRFERYEKEGDIPIKEGFPEINLEEKLELGRESLQTGFWIGNDSLLSRHHVSIQLLKKEEDWIWEIEDLASTLGTMVFWNKLPQKISADSIRIPKVEMENSGLGLKVGWLGWSLGLRVGIEKGELRIYPYVESDEQQIDIKDIIKIDKNKEITLISGRGLSLKDEENLKVVVIKGEEFYSFVTGKKIYTFYPYRDGIVLREKSESADNYSYVEKRILEWRGSEIIITTTPSARSETVVSFFEESPPWLPRSDTETAYIQPKSDENKKSSSALGGIDFTRLPIVTQAITNLGSSPLMPSSYLSLRQLNLSEECLAMQRLASSGISPHPERLKSFLQASCLQDKIGEEKDKALGVLTEVLRDEESSLRPTEPGLLDILVALEFATSPQQLKEIFLGKGI